jgi:two-component system chemotaxis response regulator CheY
MADEKFRRRWIKFPSPGAKSQRALSRKRQAGYLENCGLSGGFLPMTPRAQRLLVIEDDPDLLAVMVRVLTRAGYDVEGAASGTKGLAFAEASQLSLVLTDIIMSDMDGIEVLLALRKRRPDVPVVAVSGGGKLPGAEFLDLASRLGAAATLCKPFSPEELLAIVQQTLVKAPKGTGAPPP